MITQGKIDILVITEIKTDSTFPLNQIAIQGHSKPYRFDRNRNGGGVFIYVPEDTPSRELKIHNTPEAIENIGKALDKYSKHYDKFVLIGDFKAQEPEPCPSQILYEYNAESIVKENAYFKNVLKPSCIDLFITNNPFRFQNKIAVTDRLSDFHKMVITVMKMSFKKHSPTERHYRDYKCFDRTKFINNLKEKLSEGISNYESFESTFIEVLNKHAPLKKKLLRAYHTPYITKTLRKAIMRRSQLETKYLKIKTQTNLKLYKKHKTLCSTLYTRYRRKYYESLDMKNVLVKNFGKR